MLTTRLIHPPLLEALAVAGHGSRILIGDGNFPYATARHPSARLVFLNLRPGSLTVPELLTTMLTAIAVESATVMSAPPEIDVPAHADYARILGPSVPIDGVERFAFYEQARSQDVGLVVASGDERLYANIILTVGVV